MLQIFPGAELQSLRKISIRVKRLKTKVLSFDGDKERVSLGLKQLMDNPWEKIIEKYPVGSIVEGKVVNLTDYGVFVELESGVEGLVSYIRNVLDKRN